MSFPGTTASIDEHEGHVARTSPSCMSMPRTSSPVDATHHDLNLGSLRALRLWRQDLARSRTKADWMNSHVSPSRPAAARSMTPTLT